MGSWFDRSKPLKGRAGFDLITSAALLLLVSAPQGLAEDEPTASAPLPPLLRDVRAAGGRRQMSDSAASDNQSDSRAPAIRFDRPKSRLSQKKPRPHSASYFGTSVAKKREAPARLGHHSMDADSSRQGHRTLASEKKQRRDRSPAEPRIGQLSPPSNYPNPPSGSTTEPRAEPRQPPLLFYPNYFARPPAYGSVPSYPYAWAPPGPRVFR